MTVGPEAPDRPDAEAASTLGVSRETIAGLRAFERLLEKWTRTVNLIGKTSRTDVWNRHIVDSAQIFRLAPPNPTRWLDVGSGAGFPGLVCALLARDAGYVTHFTLVESDKRKCAFLATVQRELGLSLTILPKRIEDLPDLDANVVTARALAPLDTLFSLTARHLASSPTLLFPKGASHAAEIRQAQQHWRFACDPHPSITHPEARILICGRPHRRQEANVSHENDLRR